MSDSRRLPLVTKENPWVSMATPVLWTCSSMYLNTKERKDERPKSYFTSFCKSTVQTKDFMILLDNLACMTGAIS